MENNNHGGIRRGAGAPTKEDKGKNRGIRLNDAEYDKYKLLGGAKWIKQILKRAKLQ